MAQGVSSLGVNVEVGTAAAEITDFPDIGTITFVDLGCVVSTDLPLPETQFFEDKCLGQTNRVVKSIPTWLMPGEMSLNLKYGQDAFNQINTWQAVSKRLYVRLTFPKQLVPSTGVLQATAATAVYRAYIRQPKVDFPEDGGRVPITLTLKVDSEVQFTKGTATT